MLRAMGVTAAAGMVVNCGGDDDDDDAGGGGGGGEGGGGAHGNFPETPEWNFVFVNHVTTNPFFVPTQYGIEDASALLGTSFQWTGSETSDIPEMVDAFEAAIAGNADGIAVCLVDLEAFNDPIEQALAAGIPVVSYNADAGEQPDGVCRPGPLRVRDSRWGSGSSRSSARAPSHCSSPRPASSTSSPASTERSPPSRSPALRSRSRTSPPVPSWRKLSTVEAYYLGHTDVAGMFAVDAGSTQGVGQVVQSQDRERAR